MRVREVINKLLDHIKTEPGYIRISQSDGTWDIELYLYGSDKYYIRDAHTLRDAMNFFIQMYDVRRAKE